MTHITEIAINLNCRMSWSYKASKKFLFEDPPEGMGLMQASPPLHQVTYYIFNGANRVYIVRLDLTNTQSC